jgi:hypothetical protein
VGQSDLKQALEVEREKGQPEEHTQQNQEEDPQDHLEVH